MQCLGRVGCPVDKGAYATQITTTVVEHEITREKSSCDPLGPENIGRNLANAGYEPADG